ncbi:NnrS family protein [Novosphingobium sp.]|uniref:NnrS family protein n=1 Tax=Novosphingobium sp. TaxID=1874826 RepID=UPI0035B43E19
MRPSLLPALLFAAPHRLPFLTGSLGLGAIALWWLVRLVSLNFGWPELPAAALPATLLHAPAMLLLVYPAFIFGFLLTVFPRWMGQRDIAARQFGSVAVGLALGMGLAIVGLWGGLDGLVRTGFGLFALSWGLALIVLLRVFVAHLRSGQSPCWHALSALIALAVGLLALGLALTFMFGGDPRPLRWSNVLGLSGFVLPVFLTVAHRMVPFFAGNVVEGYQRWRPDWLLAALWILLAGRCLAGLALSAPLSALANLGLAAVTGLMAWKWWPRGAAPGLLKVLIWGFVWAPIGFALAALAETELTLGLAPVHALALGFAGSLLVGMVTRVTHGHSGRSLTMAPLPWLAFGTVQLAVILRIGAALRADQSALLIAAALVFVAGLLPWLLRNALIYLRPRKDGRPG